MFVCTTISNYNTLPPSLPLPKSRTEKSGLTACRIVCRVYLLRMTINYSVQYGMSEEAEANYRKAQPQVKRRKRSGSCAWVFRYFANTVKS